MRSFGLHFRMQEAFEMNWQEPSPAATDAAQHSASLIPHRQEATNIC